MAIAVAQALGKVAGAAAGFIGDSFSEAAGKMETAAKEAGKNMPDPNKGPQFRTSDQAGVTQQQAGRNTSPEAAQQANQTVQQSQTRENVKTQAKNSPQPTQA